MNYTTLLHYVVPTTNTLPTTGTTATLTANQFGVFLPSYAPATAGNAGAADYLFVAQGRPNDDLNLKSVKSDIFSPRNVISKWFIEGSATSQVQVTEISDFTAHCGDVYSITLRAWSNKINASYANGWETPITVKGPCCDCGDDPCETLDATATEALVDEFIAKINSQPIGEYIVASKTGSGLSTVLVLTGVAIEPDPRTCDPYANPYFFDGVRFEAYAQVDPPTTMDYAVDDGCTTFATVTKTQNLTYPIGTPEQVAKTEQFWRSAKYPNFKQLYTDPAFNLMNVSLVEDTVPAYDTIQIRFRNDERHQNFGTFANQESTVLINVAPAQSAALLAILEAQLGDFEDKSL